MSARAKSPAPRERSELAERAEGARSVEGSARAQRVVETETNTRRMILGIRHHGPGSARSVLSELERVRPAIVLIEGPSDADPLLPLVADPELVPPVALLAYDATQPRTSAFWPFAA